MMRRVLGIDPGGTTGLALVEFGDGSINVLVAAELSRVAAYQWIRHTLDDVDAPVLAVAVERYSITARTSKLTQQPDALKVIGASESEAIHAGVQFFVEQASADAKTAWTSERLKEHDLKVIGGHARDALRHAMLWIQRNFPEAVVR